MTSARVAIRAVPCWRKLKHHRRLGHNAGTGKLDVVAAEKHAHILLETDRPQEVWDIAAPQEEGPVNGAAMRPRVVSPPVLDVRRRAQRRVPGVHWITGAAVPPVARRTRARRTRQRSRAGATRPDTSAMAVDPTLALVVAAQFR